MNAAAYQRSTYTPIKQQSLEAALRLNIDLCLTQRRKRPWAKWPPYRYYELHAGPGRDPKTGEDGSPLVFLRAATDLGIPFEAIFYECDMLNAAALRAVIAERGYANAEVRNADHDTLLAELDSYQYQQGAVYADPSNACVPWAVLRHMNSRYPQMDALINVAGASYKRGVKLPSYVHMNEALPSIKDHWIIRQLYGQHQWSILVGTNWKNYPKYERYGFWPWDDERGRGIYEKLAYTNEERGAGQLPLWASL